MTTGAQKTYYKVIDTLKQFEIPSPYSKESSSTLTNNPFWEEVKQLPGDRITWDYYHRWSPRMFSENPYRFVREELCKKYAWAITDPGSLTFVAEWLTPLAVEMGAGMGYWAWQMSQLGVDIVAYDIAPPSLIATNHYHSPRDREDKEFLNQTVETFFPVQLGKPEILAQHSDRTLFLCWPPYASDMAFACLNAYQGKRLVYIGEGDGGCTGDDAFHERLGTEWTEVASHQLIQWDGIHDCAMVYERVTDKGNEP